MKKQKYIVFGFVIMLLAAIMLGSPALAQNVGKTIDVLYRDMKIYVDGNLM